MGKLPVIYAVITQDDAIDTYWRDRAHAEEYVSFFGTPDSFGNVPARVVEYEPAVPRCRTCEHFKEFTRVRNLKWVTSPGCTHKDGLANAPQDGSGYCSWHPDNMRRDRKG